MITIPHTNSNLYSVPKFIVFKSQKDLLTRTEVVALEQFCLQTDDSNDIAINKIPQQTFFFVISKSDQLIQDQTQLLYSVNVVSECLLLNTNRAIFLAISWRYLAF